MFMLLQYYITLHYITLHYITLHYITLYSTDIVAWAGVQVLGSVLSRTMLLSIEVAVEYWLSLTWSPQAQWLCDSTHDSPLRDEVNPPAF